MAAYSAIIKGAGKVMVVDRHPDRLAAGRDRSAPSRSTTPQATPSSSSWTQTNGLGADRGCECVGYQAHDPHGQRAAQPDPEPARAARSGSPAASASSACSCPQDPGGPDELAQQGEIAFDFGKFWFKGQTMGTGPVPGQEVQPGAARPHRRRKGQPSFIVSHELPLDQAPEGYKHFDSRDDGWTKVVLHPAGA